MRLEFLLFICVNRLVDCFRSHKTTSTRLSSVVSLAAVSKIKSILDSGAEKVNSVFGLKDHPGFAYGIGCDQWKASGYEGVVNGWSGEPKISWMASSYFSSTIAENIYERVDFNLFVTPNYEVPHLRMSISSTEKSYIVLFDYLPREDLVASLKHYDTYFKGLDNFVSAAERLPGVTVNLPPAIFLSRILRGPFALSITLDKQTTGADDTLSQLSYDHLKRWIEWMETAQPVERRQRGALFSRDNSLHKLRFQENKFEIAAVMNPDFAPKAAELAAALIGPGDEAYIGQGS